ncbi:hypothetical protein PIB30_029162 [Stylosanthes scabra]|uniref:Uncharacterized protein n=1 Tax=Stylosanthes scabra TaxID=79078 RepID=A0ABU6Y8C8_9FABA|nr:hypothetical protein [Stylosanthes scabra]
MGRVLLEGYMAVVFHLLGVVPNGPVRTTKYNIKLKWLRTRLQEMPLDELDHALVQYACRYIMYIIGGVLMLDKANNTVHVRFLPCWIILMASIATIRVVLFFVGFIELCASQLTGMLRV